jgi:four helix bundle protein
MDGEGGIAGDEKWWLSESSADYGTEGSPPSLKHRTKQYALRIIRLYSALPRTTEAQVIGKQLLRSGTSVGANYREGFRSRSPAEYISKLETALQELEETHYWMELLIESEVMMADRLRELLQESDELTAILVTCIRKARTTRQSKQA